MILFSLIKKKNYLNSFCVTPTLHRNVFSQNIVKKNALCQNKLYIFIRRFVLLFIKLNSSIDRFFLNKFYRWWNICSEGWVTIARVVFNFQWLFIKKHRSGFIHISWFNIFHSRTNRFHPTQKLVFLVNLWGYE